jgi:predicted  nucleic acid-binding Zn-ribbon protein
MQGMDRLLALQEIDTALDRLRTRRDALASGQTLTTARAEADVAEQGLGELRLQLDELGRDQTRFENEIDSLSQKEAAENRRMYDGSIVNTKELEALQHELANLKKRRSDREDELLALMEQREEREQRAAEAEAKATDLRSSLEATSDAADEELGGVETDLERRTAERAELTPPVDPELLELYEDLRKQKKGVAAVALTDGVCQGCHEKLSAMEVDKIKKTEGVRRCPYCRRILVL